MITLQNKLIYLSQHNSIQTRLSWSQQGTCKKENIFYLNVFRLLHLIEQKKVKGFLYTNMHAEKGGQQIRRQELSMIVPPIQVARMYYTNKKIKKRYDTLYEIFKLQGKVIK